MSKPQQDFEKGIAFHRAGRLNEARLCYESTLKAQPKNSDALHLLGLVYVANKQFDRGISLIQLCLRIQPRFADAHFNLGNAYQAAGELKQAAASYQQALALKPNFPAAQCNLGNTLYALGELD